MLKSKCFLSALLLFRKSPAASPRRGLTVINIKYYGRNIMDGFPQIQILWPKYYGQILWPKYYGRGQTVTQIPTDLPLNIMAKIPFNDGDFSAGPRSQRRTTPRDLPPNRQQKSASAQTHFPTRLAISYPRGRRSVEKRKKSENRKMGENLKQREWKKWKQRNTAELEAKPGTENGEIGKW